MSVIIIMMGIVLLSLRCVLVLNHFAHSAGLRSMVQATQSGVVFVIIVVVVVVVVPVVASHVPVVASNAPWSLVTPPLVASNAPWSLISEVKRRLGGVLGHKNEFRKRDILRSQNGPMHI